ncbi:orotidine-5'-phosphate decarboxylase [Christiangramia salexigens]|uniref:Orotidine-5'-phosphate decarboxylase n=1 Tax=Christiangramia salexigens TaxID=1913577 RepID=A0A1L3J4Z3_9FLAO|nr:orotidine-5'-phosphate decarboxylase [Christiangramia salexigens]APG60173.1 orotidine 5'-phosphate decarboxylase [Christiangramia salexigens]
MTSKELTQQIFKKKSFLCVGLDTDLEKMPTYLLSEKDPVFSFNKAIIDATHEYCVAYKPNIAFYEAIGVDGWKALKKTIDYLHSEYPEIYTIADAKRGDIGNTSRMYAKAFFEDLGFDSITVAPYMGKDSIEPFLEFTNKHTILLALTSNEGAFDFQTLKTEDDLLYKKVIQKSREWKNSENLMYVVGATKAEYLSEIRKIIPENFLLVPGVGAQGGSLEEVCKYGMTKDVGLLVNSSRKIIYASDSSNFAEIAGARAEALQRQMAVELENITS